MPMDADLPKLENLAKADSMYSGPDYVQPISTDQLSKRKAAEQLISSVRDGKPIMVASGPTLIERLKKEYQNGDYEAVIRDGEQAYLSTQGKGALSEDKYNIVNRVGDMLAESYFQVGSRQMSEGEYSKGVGSFAKSVEIDSDYRGKTLDALEKATDDLFSKKTEDAYNSVLKIVDTALGFDFYNNSAMLHNQKGSAYRKKNETQLALNEYGAALEINPQYSIATFNIAVTYFVMGKYQESFNQLGKISTTDPLFKLAQKKKAIIKENYGEFLTIK